MTEKLLRLSHQLSVRDPLGLTSGLPYTQVYCNVYACGGRHTKERKMINIQRKKKWGWFFSSWRHFSDNRLQFVICIFDFQLVANTVPDWHELQVRYSGSKTHQMLCLLCFLLLVFLIEGRITTKPGFAF